MENITWSVASMIEETEVMLRSAKEEEVQVAPAPAINPFASSREPLPYDPMLGWYTAATLSGLLILFLACVGLEKVKDKILIAFEKDHQGNAGAGGGDKALLAGGGGCEAGQLPRTGRSSNADPKCLAENDALLGRNCVDHNYVYLTLDRPNHVDATTNQSSLPPVSEGHHPTLPPPLQGQPAAGGPPTMTTRPPTGCREGVEGGEGGVEPVPSTTTPSETAAAAEGVRSRGDEVQTTRTTPQSPSKFVAVVQQATTHMHSVKIEIVEVHSESPVHHEEMVVDDKDVHESAV